MHFNTVKDALSSVLSLANQDQVLIFDSGKPGPIVSVCALTHGNEISGVLTAAEIVQNIQNESLALGVGQLQVLLSNYEILNDATGFEALARHRGIDLNRIWADDREVIAQGPGSGEFLVRDRLLPYLHQSDCLIDLHSTSQPSTAIGILLTDSADTQSKVVQELEVPYVLTNIDEFINGCAMIDRHRQSLRDAEKQNAGFSLVIEAGQHFDFSTVATNTANVTRLLQGFGVLAGKSPPPAQPPLLLEVYYVGIAQQAGHIIEWLYTENPAGFDRIEDGQPVCKFHDELITSEGETYVVMPQLQAMNAGQEIFYLARAQLN
jgi:predicted deacylase